MSTSLAFVDTETTGLDPDQHEIWEVGLILRDSEAVEVEYLWQLPVDLGRADPMALKIGRFHERRWEQGRNQGGLKGNRTQGTKPLVVDERDMPKWCALFADLTIGAHLVGAVVSFDEERLRRLLRRHGACPMWHYHLVDVEALAAGWLAAGHDWADGPPADDKCTPPWRSEELSLAVGVEPDRFERHTALGDARWARDIYDAVNEART